MHRACRTHRERAYLTLVSTTGLRSCAIGHARLGDVWDDGKGEVRQRIRFLEKNTEVRLVTPNPELRDALRAYILASLVSSEKPTEEVSSRFLFPSARRPGCPAPFVGRTILGCLCKRAGLAAFTPHQFRHYAQSVIIVIYMIV